MHPKSTPDRLVVVPLTRGKFAIIDEADAERVLAYKWTSVQDASGLWYAYRKMIVNGVRQSVRLHRFIMNAQPGQRIDHWNGDGLDNRRCNLRFATVSQNDANRGPQANNTSGYKGVTIDRRSGKWRAVIQLHGKRIWLGLHDTREGAARAYDAAATEYFGEFAYLNSPPDD